MRIDNPSIIENISASGSHLIFSSSVVATSGSAKVTSQYMLPTPLITSASGSSAVTIDWNSGQFQIVSLTGSTGNVSLTMSNGQAGSSYVLKIIQESSSLNPCRTVSFSPRPFAPGGTGSLAISQISGAVDLISLIYDGSSYYASLGLNFY